jgi:ferric-dicitrate binding protein FerR (iron transport regulator)
MWRTASWLLLLVVSSVAFAADTAVVYGSGAVYLNGAQVNSSGAVMVGDVVQTKDTGVAQLTTVGSSVSMQSNTIVRVRERGLALDRGTVTMATGKAAAVFARDFKISPASTAWTQFDVIRSSGNIQILARKSNVTVSCGTGTPIVLKEGQQLSRDDAADCGLGQKQGGAPAAAKGPALASPTAEKAGMAAAGGLLGWALFQSDDPVSPFVP